MIRHLKQIAVGGALALASGCVTYPYATSFAYCDDQAGACYRDCEYYAGETGYGACHAACDREANACFNAAYSPYAYGGAYYSSGYGAPWAGSYGRWAPNAGYVYTYRYSYAPPRSTAPRGGYDRPRRGYDGPRTNDGRRDGGRWDGRSDGRRSDDGRRRDGAGAPGYGTGGGAGASSGGGGAPETTPSRPAGPRSGPPASGPRSGGPRSGGTGNATPRSSTGPGSRNAPAPRGPSSEPSTETAKSGEIRTEEY